jgi:hypothetical protein
VIPGTSERAAAHWEALAAATRRGAVKLLLDLDGEGAPVSRPAGFLDHALAYAARGLAQACNPIRVVEGGP